MRQSPFFCIMITNSEPCEIPEKDTNHACMNERFFLEFHMARSHNRDAAQRNRDGALNRDLFLSYRSSSLKVEIPRKFRGAEADSAHEDGDILQVSREDVEVPAEAVLDSGGDFVDQTWDVVGEGAVDDDDVRVEGVENRVQADSDVVGEILHYFEGVGVAFLVILDEAFDGDVFLSLRRRQNRLGRRLRRCTVRGSRGCRRGRAGHRGRGWCGRIRRRSRSGRCRVRRQ